MADRSTIEWTEASWNPVRGCTRVSEGCRNCYAEIMAARFSKPGQWGHGFAEIVHARAAARGDSGMDHRWTGKVALIEQQLYLPLSWRKPRRIFVNSTSDLFHEALPDAAIDRVFAVMALAPRHTFQVLTKRAERIRDYLLADRRDEMNSIAGTLMHWDEMPEASWPLPNLWLGVSVEDQAAADERIPHLLATPAAVRFLSAEPLLGPIDLTHIDVGDKVTKGYGPRRITWDALTGWEHQSNAGDRLKVGEFGRSATSNPQRRLDWVICGGESGPGARPMHPDWARSIRDQCAAAGVPFFFKQWGAWAPLMALPRMPRARVETRWLRRNGETQEIGEPEERYDDAEEMLRVSKKRAGRLLDGRTHDEYPEAPR